MGRASHVALGVAAGLAALAGAAAAQRRPFTIDSTWLRSDSAHRTVEVTVIGALSALNSGMNFDGAPPGGMLLTVPLGWTVVLHFRNDDPMLPHSLEVVDDSGPVPNGPIAPAFPTAVTPSLTLGLPLGATADVRFVADRGGAYRIFCPVVGHGAAGMWIRMHVDATAPGPSLTTFP